MNERSGAMTSAVKKSRETPLARLSEQEIEKLAKELDAIHDEVFADLGERDRRYIKTVISVERQIVVVGRVLLLASRSKTAWAAGHRVSRHGQDPGEHGDRPQRHARPMGLDERSRYPFLGLGLGHRVQRGVMEALAQLHPPHLHQHSRQGQGSRLRDHADRPEPEMGAAVPVPADLQPAADAAVRVGRGRPRPGHRRHTQARKAVVGGAQGPQRHRGQGARADHTRTTSVGR